MNLVFRFLWTLLASPWRPRVDLLDLCRTQFRVWPTDCDLLFHVNNGVYLSMMDIGRVDLMLRSGAFGKLRARKWYPVVASQTILYARSLGPFERFFIDTRVLAWDERAFFIEQRFVRPDGTLCATAVVRARFLASPTRDQPRRTLSSAEVLDVGGHAGTPSPPLPEWIRDWASSLQEQKGSLGAGA